MTRLSPLAYKTIHPGASTQCAMAFSGGAIICDRSRFESRSSSSSPITALRDETRHAAREAKKLETVSDVRLSDAVRSRSDFMLMRTRRKKTT